MTEILNVPDNIPQSLLDKADCVIVLPSVLKFAIVLGGSYGRGVMTCRSGKNFKGRWGAPSMIALEGGSFREAHADHGVTDRDYANACLPGPHLHPVGQCLHPGHRADVLPATCRIGGMNHWGC